MFSILKQKFVLIFLLLIISIVFSFGFWLGKAQIVYPPESVDFSVFWESWSLIKERYLDKNELDDQAMIYGAVSGMIKSLDDPYTVFLNPEEAKKFFEDVKGFFEGVGMEIAIKEDQLQIVAPLEGTPASRAGLRPGDRIIKVDGQTTLGVPIDAVVTWIRGPKNTEVTLTIYREDWAEERDLKIIREVIDIPSLKLEMLEDNIAYLRLYHFSEKANYDFNEAAIEILGSQTQKIILDLRNNPGGYLEIAREIAGWFLEKGEIVTVEDFGREKEPKEILSVGNAKLLDYPLVVLINEGSASGSEILAGALRDNRGVKLIGETSFGKGSVQELNRLQGGAALKFTIARWLTPKGELISEKGLEPDIKVEMTVDDYEQERDPQLEKALEVLKEIR